MRRIAFLVLVNAIGVVVLLLALEGVARMLPARPGAALFSDPGLRQRGRPFVERHEIRGFKLKTGVYDFKDTEIRINRDGFRGPRLGSQLPDRFEIVAFGDSITFGWGLPQGETWPFALRRKLTRGRRNELAVVNAGVPSYTSSQVRLYVEEILTGDLVDPELVLVSVQWNDVWYSTLPNWYPEVLVYQQPAKWRMFLLINSHVMRRIMLREVSSATRENVFNERALALYTRNLTEIIDLCAAHEVPLAFVAAPFDADHAEESPLVELQMRFSTPFLVSMAQKYDAAMSELAAERGVAVIDHHLSFRNLHQRDLFLDVVHPNTLGSERIALDVARELVARGLVPAFSQVE